MVVDAHGPRVRRQLRLRPDGRRRPAPADAVRVDPDGTATVAAEDLLFPNGSVITPDGGTLIVGETVGARYTAFTIADDGSLTDRRVWAQVAPDAAARRARPRRCRRCKFGPDGCTLDAEGHIWAADGVGAPRARASRPGGEIVDEIPAPEGSACSPACSAATTAGRCCCARAGLRRGQPQSAREAVLLTTTVDVPHAGAP